MRKFIYTGFLFLLSQFAYAQELQILSGHVTDSITGEVLIAASIHAFVEGGNTGLISNKEGNFSLRLEGSADSLRFSMIGYHSKTLMPAQFLHHPFLQIRLSPNPENLQEITVKPTPAIDIVKLAIAAIASFSPTTKFESKGFYREIIRDKEQYFSVAEAVFLAQFDPAKQASKLKLERGRSREDVSYTRLFEDFHPSGGPQLGVSESFLLRKPDFLNLKKIDEFIYRVEKMVYLDDRRIYCIHFDQKPGVKEALEMGRLYIDAEDFAILKYEAENSPAGVPYIKSLTGTDKVFAEILHIDLQRKHWKRTVEFTRLGNKYLLSHADVELNIGYKQPKKNIDLDLTINVELLMSDPFSPIISEIRKEEEWKRKDLVINLPTDFDTAYWGNRNIISPTEQVREIIATIGKSNGEVGGSELKDGWSYVNRNLFLARQEKDSILMLPLMKSLWEDEQSGGMIYKNQDGDFSFESRLDLLKKSDPAVSPDRGFQQAGIMIRKEAGSRENYFFLGLGTGGNSNAKLFFKRTLDNKSKTVVLHEEAMKGNIRIVKKGKKLLAFFRSDPAGGWEKVGEYEVDWLNSKLQVGLAIFAHFSGDGPKMVPDMQAVFSELKLQGI